MANISKINVNGTEYNIDSVTTNGHTVNKDVPSNAVFTDNNNRKAFYATCDTAADAQKKVATLANSDGWELKAGTIVGVKYTNTNTYSSTDEAPLTLNVNNTGDKQIYASNVLSPTGTQTTFYGYAGQIMYYMYDGTYWAFLGHSADNNSDTKVRQTLKSDNVDRPLLMAYSNTSTTTGNVDNVSYRNNSIYANASTGNIHATKLNGVTIGDSPKFTDSHRPIQMNGSQILGDNTTALNLKAGVNVTMINNNSGEVTINSKYFSQALDGTPTGGASLLNNIYYETLASSATADIHLGVDMEFLWENSSLTTNSTFADQTIALDLSGYSFVYIIFCIASSNTTYLDNKDVTKITKVGCYDIAYSRAGTSNFESGTPMLSERLYQVTSTGIIFSACANATVGSSYSSPSNKYVIPKIIYGIR